MHIVIFGYVDPGLGLLAWQAIVALFLGVLFYVKKTRDWAIGLLRKLFRPNKSPQPAATPLKASRNSMGQ